MTARTAHAADRIADRVLAIRARAPQRSFATLVGIDGRSGAGKTRLASAVAADLRATGATVFTVSMDELYPGWEGLAAAARSLPQDILEPLGAGRIPAYRRWDWAAQTPGDLVTIPTTDVLIIEGVGSTAHARRADFALTVWAQAAEATRMDRACARAGQGDYAAFAACWATQEDALFGPDTYPEAPPGFDFVHEVGALTEEPS